MVWRNGLKFLPLVAAVFAVLLMIFLVPAISAQTENDYVVQSEPSPLVDGASRVGSTSDSLSNAQTQDNVFENISEVNVASPATTTYDFSSGTGTDRWARTNANVDEPAAPYTTVHFDGTPPEGDWSEVTYSKIQTLDQTWQLASGTSGDYSALQYKLTITESVANITNIDIVQTVYIQTAGTTLGVWVWNFNTSAWVQVGADYTVNSTSSPGETFTRSITSDFSDYINSGTIYVIVVANTTNKDYRVDYIKFDVTYVQYDYRINWEHRVTSIGSNDNYFVRVYGYAESGETFSINVWDGNTWADNGYDLPTDSPSWVIYQIPNNWVSGGAVSIKFDDDNSGDNADQSIYIDYCLVRGVTTPPSFDYTINASSILTIQPGADNATDITITLVQGDTDNVVMSGSWIGGTPTGIGTTFTPSSGNPTYSSTLTFSANSSASQGNYTYTVSATGAGLVHTTDITVVVGSPAFDFSLSPSPASLTVSQGGTATSTISVSLVSGLPENVALSGSWVGTAPSGVDASFSQSSGSPTYSSILTFATTQSASTGTSTYRVTATSGDNSYTQDITLTVNEAAFGFSISASPDNLALTRSDSATSTVSLSQLTGTSKTVSLSGSWVGTTPTGVSAAFSLSSGTPPFDSGLTFTTTSAASSGTFTYRVSGTYWGVIQTDDIQVVVNTQLAMTLTTDKDNYQQGETIQISGTAKDPEGNTLSSGNVTVRISYENGSWENSAQISNGAYSGSFQISFGNPAGTWAISASASDNLGHSSYTIKNVTVAIPVAYAYYTVQIMSPVAGLSYSRGDNVDISVQVTESGTSVENASVSFVSPTGSSVALTEVSPGVYTGKYALGWDAPDGTWSVTVEGTKTVENTFKAGGGFINVVVDPATLQVTLLSPTDRRFDVGQSVKITAEVSYPDGNPANDLTLVATKPNGEEIALAYENAGVYSASYVLTEQDVGSWALGVSVEDLHGNSGSKSSVISITPMSTVGFLAAYWWAIVPTVLVAVGVPGLLIRRQLIGKRLVQKLEATKSEMKEIPKMKKEAAVRYYTKGEISRDAYKELIKSYDARHTVLKNEERVLQEKIKKRAVDKK